MMTHIAEESAGNMSSMRSDWEWVERAVWTDRMLKALQSGVKGNKWHNLIDKVYAPVNLDRAYEKVAKNKGAAGVDHVSVSRYKQELEHNQAMLAEQLHGGTYKPLPVLRTYIDKPGSKDKRPLGIPSLRDRIAQRALKHVIEPIFEATFSPSSHGFRPGMGCKDALREVTRLLDAGYTQVVDADIRAFFDEIPKRRLMECVCSCIADGKILDLIQSYLDQGIMEEMSYWEPEKGVPQGAVISPLLANIFLNAFDWTMHQYGIRIVRYADDFVMLCRNRDEAEAALKHAEVWMRENELTLHPEKTKLVDMDINKAEFSFLGYRFLRHVNRQGKTRILKLVSGKSQQKLRHKLRRITKRCNAHGMPEIIRQLNQVLRGWFNYFKHCFPRVLGNVDSYVRRRLRRILRKRIKRKRGMGQNLNDHKRWPNVFFSDLGYFSLEAAHARVLQSLRG